MKKIMLIMSLLIISKIVNCQDSLVIDMDAYNFTWDTVGYIEIPDSIQIIYLSQSDAMLTFRILWEHYKIKCHNDSSLINTHKSISGEWCIIGNSGHCTIENHYHKVWIHKQPTFEDFMNWLNHYYKIESIK